MDRFNCGTKSSFVSRISYASGTLAIQFKGSGTVYEYFFVPKKVYVGLTRAKSIGTYYAKKVKGQYPVRASEAQ